jgi:hypothetical protein
MGGNNVVGAFWLETSTGVPVSRFANISIDAVLGDNRDGVR